MLRPQATLLQATRTVPLTLPSCRRWPAAARRPLAAMILSTTRTDRSTKKPLSSAPAKGALLAARASPDHASEFSAPLSVLEPLSYSQAMGGSAGFRVGGDGSMEATPTTKKSEKDNAANSIKSRVARFASRFVCIALVMCMAFAAVAPSAFAARSGGRMGGSAFGGGGGAMAASHSISSSSYSSYRGSSSSGRSSSFTAAAPSARGGPLFRYSPVSASLSSSSSPTRLNSLTLGWGLVPFGGFGYGGYPAVYAGGGGGGLSDFLFFGLFALIAVSAISSFTRARSDSDYDADEDGQAYDDGVTVAKLQVGLLSSARGLKRDLERIAARADTSTPAGLHFVLQETVLSLLRNPEYAVYGAAKTLRGKSLAKAEQKFNEMSLAERGKVREETLVNVSGIRREGGFKGKGGGGAKGDGATTTAPGDEELIVVTVLVASRGRFKLPAVRSGAELREALSTLGAVPSDGVLGVEVLWTPQDPQDSYSKGELMVDFPDLNNL